MSRATTRDIPTVVQAGVSKRQSLLGVYAVLAKARLSAMVVLTAGAGFLIGSSTYLDWLLFLWAMLGTALAAASAATLNQVIEVRRDAMMRRTRTRPLPSGRISRAHATLWGIGLGLAGVLVLALLVNPLTAVLGGANILIYLLIYTPFKSRSSLNTLIGAVCGAVPPVMGWTAATGGLDSGGWVLGGILFIWQIPHFLALAWMYREDYSRGGFRMLPVLDETGRFTGPIVVVYCMALLPVSLLLATLGYVGWIYAAGALLLGLLFLGAAVRLWQRLDDHSARRLFLASILYIPLLLLLIVLDRTPMIDPAAQGRETATQTLTPGPTESVASRFDGAAWRHGVTRSAVAHVHTRESRN